MFTQIFWWKKSSYFSDSTITIRSKVTSCYKSMPTYFHIKYMTRLFIIKCLHYFCFQIYRLIFCGIYCYLYCIEHTYVSYVMNYCFVWFVQLILIKSYNSKRWCKVYNIKQISFRLSVTPDIDKSDAICHVHINSKTSMAVGLNCNNFLH